MSFPLFLAEHGIITADVILNELQRVLKQKIQLPGEQIQEILTFLESQIVQPKPISPPSIPVRDEDDQWVLASALAAKADVFVTGDKALLEIAGIGQWLDDHRSAWLLESGQETHKEVNAHRDQSEAIDELGTKLRHRLIPPIL